MIRSSGRHRAALRDATGAVCAVLGMLVLTGLSAAPASAAVVGTGDSGAAFAAFGDSYSAGEGSGSYLRGTAVPGTNVCHRSTLAYSQLLVAEQDPASSAFVACSGAVTADLFAPNNNGNKMPDGQLEPAQLCQPDAGAGIDPCDGARPPALGPDTRTVTLTIGGNDVGFAKVVQTCLFATEARYRVGLPGRGCRYDAATWKNTTTRIAALGGLKQATSPYGSQIHSIASVLTAIHSVAPNAQVYIAGYPKIFQRTSTSDCVVGAATDGTTKIPLAVTADDARTLDDAATLLDDTVRASVDKAGPWATYVDPSTFDGHGLCTDESWLNPVHASVSLRSAASAVVVQPDPGSLHPTPQGQQDGYEAAFVSAGV